LDDLGLPHNGKPYSCLTGKKTKDTYGIRRIVELVGGFNPSDGIWRIVELVGGFNPSDGIWRIVELVGGFNPSDGIWRIVELVGGFNPSEKYEFASWDDYSQYMGKS